MKRMFLVKERKRILTLVFDILGESIAVRAESKTRKPYYGEEQARSAIESDLFCCSNADRIEQTDLRMKKNTHK